MSIPYTYDAYEISMYIFVSTYTDGNTGQVDRPPMHYTTAERGTDFFSKPHLFKSTNSHHFKPMAKESVSPPLSSAGPQPSFDGQLGVYDAMMSCMKSANPSVCNFKPQHLPFEYANYFQQSLTNKSNFDINYPDYTNPLNYLFNQAPCNSNSLSNMTRNGAFLSQAHTIPFPPFYNKSLDKLKKS